MAKKTQGDKIVKDKADLKADANKPAKLNRTARRERDNACKAKAKAEAAEKGLKFDDSIPAQQFFQNYEKAFKTATAAGPIEAATTEQTDAEKRLEAAGTDDMHVDDTLVEESAAADAAKKALLEKAAADNAVTAATVKETGPAKPVTGSGNNKPGKKDGQKKGGDLSDERRAAIAAKAKAKVRATTTGAPWNDSIPDVDFVTNFDDAYMRATTPVLTEAEQATLEDLKSKHVDDTANDNENAGDLPANETRPDVVTAANAPAALVAAMHTDKTQSAVITYDPNSTDVNRQKGEPKSEWKARVKRLKETAAVTAASTAAPTAELPEDQTRNGPAPQAELTAEQQAIADTFLNAENTDEPAANPGEEQTPVADPSDETATDDTNNPTPTPDVQPAADAPVATPEPVETPVPAVEAVTKPTVVVDNTKPKSTTDSDHGEENREETKKLYGAFYTADNAQHLENANFFLGRAIVAEQDKAEQRFYLNLAQAMKAEAAAFGQKLEASKLVSELKALNLYNAEAHPTQRAA